MSVHMEAVETQGMDSCLPMACTFSKSSAVCSSNIPVQIQGPSCSQERTLFLASSEQLKLDDGVVSALGWQEGCDSC